MVQVLVFLGKDVEVWRSKQSVTLKSSNANVEMRMKTGLVWPKLSDPSHTIGILLKRHF